MRTLYKNKLNLWKVSKIGEEDVVDDSGYPTGEIKPVYGEPEKIKLPLYPASGDIKERTFGKDADISMISASRIKLKENDLIFHNEPVDNYETTYNYYIDSILPSLNSYNYGLKRRV